MCTLCEEAFDTGLSLRPEWFNSGNSAQLSLCSAWFSLSKDMVLVYNWRVGVGVTLIFPPHISSRLW